MLATSDGEKRPTLPRKLPLGNVRSTTRAFPHSPASQTESMSTAAANKGKRCPSEPVVPLTQHARPTEAKTTPEVREQDLNKTQKADKVQRSEQSHVEGKVWIDVGAEGRGGGHWRGHSCEKGSERGQK